MHSRLQHKSFSGVIETAGQTLVEGEQGSSEDQVSIQIYTLIYSSSKCYRETLFYSLFYIKTGGLQEDCQ